MFSPVSFLKEYMAVRSLMKSQWLHPKEIQFLQEKKLRALVNHCYDQVPYYHGLFKERNLKPNDIRSIEDLQKLPILTREIVRQNFQQLIASNFPTKLLQLCSTGGSTGEPLKFMDDIASLRWINAAVIRSFHWAGYKRFDKIVNVWGLPSQQNIIPTKLWQRQMTLSTFGLGEQQIKEILERIKAFKPKGLRGYPSALYLLAQLSDGIKVDFVISTSEMLFPHYRKTLEDKFGCPVYDNYSSRELMIASECEYHSGLHIAAENCILEFVKKGEQVATGELGSILVTDLTKYGMPFLRYEIGDVGRASSELCSCNRGLPLMKAIEGRITDIIYTPSGKFISSPAVTLIFKDLDVKQYQVIQKSYEKLIIKIVKGETYSNKDNKFVLDYFQKYAPDMEIEIEFVEEIPPTRSGKRHVVVSEIAC